MSLVHILSAVSVILAHEPLLVSVLPRHSFAYIEFTDRDSVQSAIGLHETLFRGRVLKVRSIQDMM